MANAADWAMVFITAVYVFLTSKILIANKEAADISRKQLEKAQEQYDETKRLTYMPYLQIIDNSQLPDEPIDIDIDACTSSDHCCQTVVALKNIGNGVATDLKYKFECKESKQCNEGGFSITAIDRFGEYRIQINFYAEGDYNKYHPVLTLFFKDLIGNSYKQSVKIVFKESREQSSLDVHFNNYEKPIKINN